MSPTTSRSPWHSVDPGASELLRCINLDGDPTPASPGGTGDERNLAGEWLGAHDCAVGAASIIGRQLGTCNSDDCDQVFLDESKNASRRFGSTTCQNRVKIAVLRRQEASNI